MNELQKKLVIVGLTAFIAWFLLALGNDSFYYLNTGNFDTFTRTAIYTNSLTASSPATWINLLTFITWVGSAIAFNIYKQDK